MSGVLFFFNVMKLTIRGGSIRKYLLSVLVLGATASLWAQGLDKEDESDKTPGIEGLMELDPFLFTGRRLQEFPENIPASVTSIDRQEIENTGSTTLVDVLEKKAGLYFRSLTGTPVESQVDMRGFGENSGVRTLIIVDGVRLNRPDVAPLNWLQLPLGEIEKVEVLRGAQTAIYGNQAMGGVIRITTRRGDSDPGGSITGLVGSYHTRELRASYAGREGALSYAVGGDYNQSDGYRTHSDYRGRSAFLNLGYDVTDNWIIRVGGSFLDSELEYPGPLTPGQFAQDPRQAGLWGQGYNNGQYTTLTLGTEYQVNEQATFQVDTGYSRQDLKGEQWGNLSELDLDSYQASPSLRITSKQATIMLGMDWQHDGLGQRQYLGPTSAIQTGVADLSQDALAAFVHGQYFLTDTWLLSAGVRLEQHQLEGSYAPVAPFPGVPFSATKSDIGHAWELGLVFKPVEEWRIYGRLDSVYRFPATDEVAAYQGFPMAQPFNFSLKPETGTSVELGAEWNRDGWFVQGNGFAFWLQDEISYDPILNLNVNLFETRRYGMDLAAGYANEHFGVRVDYHYIDAVFTSGPNVGKEVPLVPKHRISVRGELRPISSLTIVARYSYVGEQYQGSDFSNTLPPLDDYSVVDLQLRWQPKKELQLFVGVDNVFNKSYATAAFLNSYYPATGRMISGGFNFRF